MKTTLLAAVSAVAIMASAPVFAADMKAQTNANVEAEAGTNNVLEEGWNNTKKAVSDTADDVSDATSNAYSNVEAALMGDDTNASTNISIDTRMTAGGMIGQPVYNANGERVAKVRDIIVDADGKAKMVILGDGDFTGLGKLAAFQYDTITKRSSDGDIITSLTEEIIDGATSFSYSADDASDTVTVIPANGYSVSALLDGELKDANNQSLGDVDNISFKNATASELIIGFDKTLGLGGKKAALDYEDAQIVRDGNSLDFKLGANQAAQFESFQKTLRN